METYFVLVCWNNIDLLDECIDSVRKQSEKNFSIIVVDNGSTDDSVKHLKKHHKDVILIETGKNNGFAIGNNLGIKRALSDPACKYVALLNTDATLRPDWLKTLKTFAVSHPKSASLQTPTLDYYDHDTLDSRGILIDHLGQAVQAGYRETRKKRTSHEVFGVNAAAALFTAAFLKAQPFGDDYFDSDMWMYLEDVDLAARAVITGWHNWYVEGSFAYHMGSASSGKNPGFSVYYIYRNNALLLLKNLPFPILLRVIPGVIYTDAKTLLSAVRGRNKLVIKKVIKGRLHGVRLFGMFIRKRKTLLKGRQISSKALWQLMNVPK